MEKQMGFLMIAGACLLVLFIVTVKNKAEFFLNFCLRAVMGGIAIFGINLFMESWGIPCAVGINLCSLLTSGTLGFSGISLLYAVAAFQFL
ncbi:MAG: pro-sigmaK processing inhibitor BofA family protein [Clostridiales bacterium]|nr:pro-sigmaK processing inhibitor BofA family protein [Clostridiales bacterium]